MEKFLRVIVEAKIDGDTGSLKETSLGVSVFDREPGYDPQLDAIVRVEARRLRAKLQQYYEQFGQGDEVLISIPTGSYAPVFTLREIQREVQKVETPDVQIRNLPPVHRARSLHFALAAALLLISGIALGRWSNLSSRRSATQITARPATSYVGFEFDPAISPDGKQLAFVWDGNQGQFNLYTKLLEVGSPVRVTTGSGHDLHPAWSPDGQYLAFLRVSPNERDLMVVPALGGTARKVLAMTPSEVGTWRADPTQMYGNPGPAWSPSGDSIAITDYTDPHFGGALFRVTPDGRRLDRLTSPAPGSHDFSPAFSPDGRSVAFIHYTSASTSDLWVVGTDGRGPRQLTRDRHDIRGISWLPDSRHLIFSSNRGSGYGIWTTSTEGAEPEPVPLNGYRITEPSVSRDGNLLAYTDSNRNSNVWRVRPDAPSAQPKAELVVASSRQSYCAHLSPDGQSIAFISDRSGTFEVWVSKSDGAEPVQLTRFQGPLVGSPRWSPDGKWIAFDARVDAHAAIYLIGITGNGLRRLNNDPFEERMPSWSNDGQFLYVSSNRGGKVQLWKAPVEGGAPQRISHGIAFTSSESPDGRTVYFTGLGSGLWQAPSPGGPEAQVPELSSFHAGLYFAVNSRGIYIVDQESSRNIMCLSFTSHKIDLIAHLEKPMVIDTPSLDVSRNGSELIYSQIDAAGSDVMLARNWR